MSLSRITLAIAVALIAISAIAATAVAEQEGQKLLVIEKEVCFDISIAAPNDVEPTSRTVCLIIDFYVYNVRNVENASVVIEFPITISIYNQTIARRVVVPLDVVGTIERIEVKNPYGGNEIIYVVPPPTQTQTAPVLHL